jgi:hypothetical protein
MDLSVTVVPRCVSRNTKTLELQHLQLVEGGLAASSGPRDWTWVVYLKTVELLLEQQTVSNRQASSHFNPLKTELV